VSIAVLEIPKELTPRYEGTKAQRQEGKSKERGRKIRRINELTRMRIE
jgi:hypothetical protein